MMATGIPYCDEVWNICIGCTKIKSGCQHCWAERLHNQRHTAWWDHRWPDAPKQYHKPFSEIQLLTDRLEQPLHWRKPRTIFVNSMSDTFHKDVPFEFIDDIMSIVYQKPEHTFMFFTKRWARALEYYNYANAATQHVMRDSVHMYFSASTQAEVDEAVPILLQIPVAVRGLSLEPLLGPIGFRLKNTGMMIVRNQGVSLNDWDVLSGTCGNLRTNKLDSIIVGCESGTNHRPCKLEWIKSIVQQCKGFRVPVYVKQIPIDGKCVTLKKKNRSIWPAWAVQEMPK
jgi:protein gp37